MKTKFVPFLWVLCLFVAIPILAQRGGKAEPRRIQFASGATSKTLTGMLSTDQVVEYVFAARKGQKVTITNSRSSLFDFKVYSEENFPDGDFDSSRTYSFEIPETGDYDLFVRKKRVQSSRRARYSITLGIK